MIKLEILTTSLGCAKCERALQTIKKVVNDYKGKVKVKETDVVKNPEAVIKYGVLTTPAIIINNKVVFEGVPSEKKLREKIRKALAK